MERDPGILDYTWNWVDNVDSAPVLNVLKAPRLNCNVESPMLAKMAFMCGNFLNVFPRKPDQINGTSLISELPELSQAVKECAKLRQQFLPYFVEGNLIGDSVLAGPATGFVRAHVLNGKMLVFVLNDQNQPHEIRFQSELDLWLPKRQSYEVSRYDSAGIRIDTATVGTAKWSATTSELAPGQLVIFEIEAR